MKRLRILTGHHVGAHLDLTDGVHVVGAGSDCDITITDWTFAPLELTVEGVRAACLWYDGPPDPEGRPGPERRATLTDLVAREFDGIVLCLGPADGAWPTDVQLLSTVFAPATARAARWARQRIPGRLVPLMLAIGVVSGVVWGGLWLDPSPPPVAVPSLDASRAVAQRALDRVAGGRVRAVAEQGAISLFGLAEDTAEATASRAAVEALRLPFNVVPRFAVATDIAETLRGANGLTNPAVRHIGKGVFTVTADVVDERAARAALDRIAADLAPAVRRVDTSFERIHSNDPLGPILSRSQQDGLSVVQTRDGVKHIVMESARVQAPEPSPRLPKSAGAAEAIRPVALTTAHAHLTRGNEP